MRNTKNEINGWLIINKAYDMGSTRVVGRIKHLLHPSKIGHAGTLDPLATGVLPIALGKATRLIPFVMSDQKTYEFDIQWGIETDSDDLAGQKIAESDCRPSKAEILKIIPQFLGKITQIPSVYSALKINGHRACDLARAGQEVHIKERIVQIYDLKLNARTSESASFTATVSKGTYIRSLAHDIAHALGTVGVVTRLHRTKDGPFDIQDSVSLEDCLENHILPMETVLVSFPKIVVDFETSERIVHGQRIKSVDYQTLDGIYVVQAPKKIIAIAEVTGSVLHPKLVF